MDIVDFNAIENPNVQKIQYRLILYLSILFWVIPEPYQKVFKVALLLYFLILYLWFFSSGILTKSQYLLPVLGCVLLAISVFNSSFQTPVINIGLSLFALTIAPHLSFELTVIKKKRLRKWAIFFCVAMFVQMLVYKASDGRPSLGYELNNSGAYLFLFFLFSDLVGSKFGKFFVLVASFFMLSRLLIFSLALFYIIRYLKHFIKEKWRFNRHVILLVIYTMFFAFNFYFLLNVEEGESYNSSRNRVTELNDSSNFVRFGINAHILGNLLNDERFIFGYGEISGGKSRDYAYTYGLMPHNELLDCIAEFGYIFTIFCFFFSGKFYKYRFYYENYEYMLPLILFTLILWVRLIIVPSIEFYYIYSFLLNRSNGINKNIKNI